MKNIKGYLFLFALVVAIGVLIVVNWKAILVSIGTLLLWGVFIVVLCIIGAFIGKGISGDRWDRE